MSQDRNPQASAALRSQLTAADEPQASAAIQITRQARWLLPPSRYRHPGDVIRLIGSGLVLIGTLTAVAIATGRLLGSGSAAVTWLGSGPAGRLLTGLVQVAFVVAVAGIDSRRPEPPPVPAAGQPGGRRGRGRRRAGRHLVPGRRRAPARGNRRHRARLVAGQRGVPRPGAARRRGGGRRGRGSVAEPSLAPDSMDRAGRRRRGPADHRHRPAGRTGSRARRWG